MGDRSTLSPAVTDNVCTFLSLKAPVDQLKKTQEALKAIEAEMLWDGPTFAVLPKVPGVDSIHEMRVSTMVLGQTMGEVLVQNAEGDKSVLVFDRDANRTMDQGARYHQVRL